MRRPASEGQALLLVVAVMWAVVLIGLLLGAVASAVAAANDRQRAADLAALAAARVMRDSYDRLFEPARIAGRPNLRRITRAAYLDSARAIAVATARRNGAELESIGFGRDAAPVGVRVAVAGETEIAGLVVAGRASAGAQLVPDAGADVGMLGSAPGEYSGPLAHRQGKPMRPDVALAFDRMAAAARADGVALLVVSGYRANSEQAVLFAAHPDPKWVAPPGRSLHRLATELDLGPRSAYGWLARNAKRFHFVQRYPWEPWHFGFTLNAGSASVVYGRDGDGLVAGGVPDFVPESYVSAFSAAAQRWNVSATLLAAQVWQESRFDPRARSRAGALGISQFMPATARAYGLRDPFDPTAAIDAQAHLMRDLLREFASVPLALAAYNAGAARVRTCGCVPPIPETIAYVAAVVARMRAAGDPTAGGAGLTVRLVS